MYGLKPTPPDDRDFKLGAVYRLPALNTLPDEYILPFTVKDQRDTDFCSAYMTCAMSEVQEGVSLEPSYSFAVSKDLSGDPDDWGQDIRTALKAHLKGALPEANSPYNLSNQTAAFLRHLKNWKVSPKETYPFRKKSFFKVTGQYDHFDNIKASLVKFGSPVGIGVDFGWSLDEQVFGTITKGYGHAMTVIGYKDNVCILLNSYGTSAGDNGLHYITREVLNHFVEKYGAYMFVDISREDAEYAIETGTRVGDNWVITLFRAFINLFR